MLDIKISARKNIRGKVLKLWLLNFLPRLLLLCGAVTGAYPFFCCFFSESALFDDIDFFCKYNYARKSAVYLLAAEAVLFLIFSAGAKFCSEAEFFYLTDKNQTRPKRFLSFYQAVRFLSCQSRLALIKGSWALLFFSPCLAASAVFAVYIYSKPMLESVFIVMLIFIFILLLCGAAFYCAACARYFMCFYLLYLNPLQSVGEAVRSSVLLTRGNIAKIILLELNILPWHLCRAFLPCAPFSLAYTKSVRACMCEKLYGENKSAAYEKAVVFYLNRLSGFSVVG